MGLWDRITWSGSTCRAAKRGTAEDRQVRAGEGSVGSSGDTGRRNWPRGTQLFWSYPNVGEGPGEQSLQELWPPRALPTPLSTPHSLSPAGEPQGSCTSSDLPLPLQVFSSK